MQRLTTTDGFVIVDIEGASAAGLARLGRKILQRSARDMARSASYSYALFGIQKSGASAGLNYDGPEPREEIRTFVEELRPRFVDEDLSLFAGKGIRGDLIGELSNYRHSDFTRATAESVVTCARWASDGDLYRTKVAIEGKPPELLVELLEEAGADVIDVEGAAEKPWLVWSAGADMILVGSRVGAMTHDGAQAFTGSTVVGWGPAAVTAKALAILSQKGVTVIPGFLAASGGLLLGHIHKDAIVGRLEASLVESAKHTDGLFVGACVTAEEFLTTWRDEALFGRPLA